MRLNIVHEGADNLKYEIREIVAVAQQLNDLGVDLTWENIGDPIHKGDFAPEWIRKAVCDITADPNSWGYCNTAGVEATREFLTQQVNDRGGVQIDANCINFYNGLGDAVAKIYGLLRRQARVLGPSPAYSTHSSGESAHSGYAPVCYHLDPANGWMPDMNEVRRLVKYNDTIAAIALLSPDNPTGAVYPPEILQKFVSIAHEFDLFLIVDEIYANIVYGDRTPFHASQWVDEVPTIAMKGISKEYPWPGGRCGWIEVLNKGRDANFAAYVDSLLAAKRLEVSSTTIPQLSIPSVMSDSRYPDHLLQKQKQYESRANEVEAAFQNAEQVIVNKPSGAFYFTVTFEPDALSNRQTLKIENPEVRKLIEDKTQNVAPDKRFVYYLMGATGIVVVPLTGFNCAIPGFRATLLEHDDQKRQWMMATIRDAISEYVHS